MKPFILLKSFASSNIYHICLDQVAAYYLFNHAEVGKEHQSGRILLNSGLTFDVDMESYHHLNETLSRQPKNAYPF